MSDAIQIIALLAAYNEEDILEQAIVHLIDQGVSVYYMDNRSTDASVEIARRYLGRGVLHIEQYPPGDDGSAGFAWRAILRRKEELSRSLDADWFIHHDADEFRESPWWGKSLHDGIAIVDRLGYSAIDFEVLNFPPIRSHFESGGDLQEAFTHWEPPQAFDKLRINCWKKTGHDVDIASTGGHEARFEGRTVFPIRFILRHYPIRGQAHGERKVFLERQPRYLKTEQADGWHVQYDDITLGHAFVRDPQSLTKYDPDAMRHHVGVQHRGVEALQSELLEAKREHSALKQLVSQPRELTDKSNGRARELDTPPADSHAHQRELDRSLATATRECSETAGLTSELQRSLAETRSLLEQSRREVAALLTSASWRWTAPLRRVKAFIDQF